MTSDPNMATENRTLGRLLARWADTLHPDDDLMDDEAHAYQWYVEGHQTLDAFAADCQADPTDSEIIDLFDQYAQAAKAVTDEDLATWIASRSGGSEALSWRTVLSEARMTGAEFRVTREALGLTTRWVADRLDVAERSVHRWEAEEREIPTAVAQRLWEWEKEAAETIARGVAAMGSVPDPVLGVPRTEDMDGWPASWWRAVAGAMQVEVPGLRIIYRS